MIMRKFKFGHSDESGSYTIEACISLVAFLLAIMFVYMQIKTMVCETIMQHAVNGMATEMATYVYVLNRAGLVINNNADKFKDVDNAYEAAKDAYSNTSSFYTKNINTFTDIYTELEGGDIKGAASTAYSSAKGFSGDAGSVVASIKNMVEMIKNIDVQQTAKDGVRAAGENALKKGSNIVLGQYYNWKLDAYLPGSRADFCKAYMIDPDSISFENSRIFPTVKNDNVLVAVTYETKPAFNFIPGNRKIVKVGCTAAWVKSNVNEIKADNP